ncbi:L-type lectin-domain containing receptor [Vigna angularis]|uniref:non-specific serine/threonine protein kinase n=1 Tax=Phaseolus angularis TaxID=3914 RepID=A0A8T0LHT1_PHAAN|nr:L-type lectin-domain containing receptor [Vigna angularis]
MAASGLLFRIILFILIIAIAITNAHTQSFECPNFSSTCIKHLKLEGSASTSGSAIQLTEENAIYPSKSFGSAGRVTYAERINLRDKSSNEPRDFITNFSFVVSSNQSIYGDGLAFFLASPNLPSTDKLQLRGGSLGVGLTDGDRELFRLGYRFLAVEFDTFRNPWDPVGAHVGININDMDSKIFETWWINMTHRKVCNCSIVYDSRNSILNVSYTGYKLSDGKVRKTTQHLSYSVDIRQELPDSVVVGISAATGRYSEQHALLSWSFSITPPSTADKEKEWKPVMITLKGIGIGAVLFLSLLGMVEISLRMIAKRKEVEVTIISQLRHRNLVKLTGWCHKKKDFLLIYEYMENGSLDSQLFRGESILPWEVRYNIALGLASALLYLQEEWEKSADENLVGEFDVKQMECLLVVGLWCANPDSAYRPAIRQVINASLSRRCETETQIEAIALATKRDGERNIEGKGCASVAIDTIGGHYYRQ